ncbi:MAG: PIN domain-containing protein [Rhodocyclaceae bacterium]
MTLPPAHAAWVARILAARPPRLVLDTNVIMALWHFRDPRLSPLLGWIEAQGATLLTRETCLDELRRVLAYSQFAIAADEQARLFEAYAGRALCLPPPTEAQQAAAAGLPQCRDRDDQKFLTLGLDGEAHVLATRDKLLLGLARRSPFREHLPIVTPERLQASLQ